VPGCGGLYYNKKEKWARAKLLRLLLSLSLTLRLPLNCHLQVKLAAVATLVKAGRQMRVTIGRF
jgi:hypothetical protein